MPKMKELPPPLADLLGASLDPKRLAEELKRTVEELGSEETPSLSLLAFKGALEHAGPEHLAERLGWGEPPSPLTLQEALEYADPKRLAQALKNIAVELGSEETSWLLALKKEVKYAQEALGHCGWEKGRIFLDGAFDAVIADRERQTGKYQKAQKESVKAREQNDPLAKTKASFKELYREYCIGEAHPTAPGFRKFVADKGGSFAMEKRMVVEKGSAVEKSVAVFCPPGGEKKDEWVRSPGFFHNTCWRLREKAKASSLRAIKTQVPDNA